MIIPTVAYNMEQNDHLPKIWFTRILQTVDVSVGLRVVNDGDSREYAKLCVWGSAHARFTGHLLNRSGYRIAN